MMAPNLDGLGFLLGFAAGAAAGSLACTLLWMFIPAGGWMLLMPLLCGVGYGIYFEVTAS